MLTEHPLCPFYNLRQQNNGIKIKDNTLKYYTRRVENGERTPTKSEVTSVRSNIQHQLHRACHISIRSNASASRTNKLQLHQVNRNPNQNFALQWLVCTLLCTVHHGKLQGGVTIMGSCTFLGELFAVGYFEIRLFEHISLPLKTKTRHCECKQE